MSDDSHIIYACRDADDEIIYIGRTRNLDERCRQHHYKSPWWPTVARIQSWPMPDEQTAKEREAEAIAQVRPRENRQHMNRYRPGVVQVDKAASPRSGRTRTIVA